MLCALPLVRRRMLLLSRRPSTAPLLLPGLREGERPTRPAPADSARSNSSPSTDCRSAGLCFSCFAWWSAAQAAGGDRQTQGEQSAEVAWQMEPPQDWLTAACWAGLG